MPVFTFLRRQSVVETGRFEAFELVDRVVEVRGVEQTDLVECPEILDGQAGDPLEQVRVQGLDDMLESLFPEVRDIHEHWDLGEELL